MINRVVLVGRLTREVDLRYTQSGTAVGRFTVAVDRNFRSASGERGTDYIRCTIWRAAAENFAKFTRKGSLVGIEGNIRTGSYENQQGQRVYTTEVYVDNFSLLEPKSVTEARPRESASEGQFGGNSYSTYGPADQFGGNSGYGQQSSSSTHSFGNQQQQDPFGGSNQAADPFPSNNGGNSGSSNFSSNQGTDSIDIADDDLPF